MYKLICWSKLNTVNLNKCLGSSIFQQIVDNLSTDYIIKIGCLNKKVKLSTAIYVEEFKKCTLISITCVNKINTYFGDSIDVNIWQLFIYDNINSIISK